MREDGKSGLAEREAAVVSGNDAVGEDFEGLGAEDVYKRQGHSPSVFEILQEAGESME